MRTATVSVMFRCVVLECEIERIPADGDGWSLPYTPAHIALVSVSIGGQDCTELLDEHLDEIEKLADAADAETRRDDTAELWFSTAEVAHA